VRLGRILVHRLHSLLRPSRAEADLQRELSVHLEQLTREYIADGMSDADARRAARREFGSVESTKEQCRDMRRVTFVEDLVKDLGYAVRQLRKSPAFTLTAVCSLALGIGANTAIFSLVNAFLLRPLPYERPDRLVTLFERNVVGSEQEMSVALGNFLDWQGSATTFDSMTAISTRTVTLSVDVPGAEPERVVACLCSGNLSATMGVAPVVGRAFRPEEDRFGAPRVAVISDDLWQRRFGGARDVLDKTIRVNELPHQIIGVMPRAFGFPSRTTDVWLPLLVNVPVAQQSRHDLHNYLVVGRVRADVPLDRAWAEIDSIAARYKNAHPDESTGKRRDTAAAPRQSRARRTAAAPLAARRGRLRAVDRVRQHRQPDVHAVGGASARNRHPLRSRRGTRPDRATADHRERGPWRGGWSRRRGAGSVDHAGACHPGAGRRGAAAVGTRPS